MRSAALKHTSIAALPSVRASAVFAISLATLLHSAPCLAVEFRTTFNDGLIWADFDYRWTITPGNLPPPGVDELEIEIPTMANGNPFPVDATTLTSGPGTTVTFHAGPPQRIVLRRIGGLLNGNWFSINSGCDPSGIMGLHDRWWRAGGVRLPPPPPPMHLAQADNLNTPVLAAVRRGEVSIQGTATASSFVRVLQDDPTQPDTAASILLGTAQVSSLGQFTVGLSPRLSAYKVSIAVAANIDGQPDTSQIVLQVMPELPGLPAANPSAIAFSAVILAGLSAVAIWRMKRKRTES